ncbi:hypothetical protein N431DRAFT_445128 [Stipitochalara longipes BDJ]|nr:hypothetical protein N431DRAFT_445128 [Stipitochalara longipes BDJ]
MASAAGKKVMAGKYMELETKFAELNEENESLRDKLGLEKSSKDNLQTWWDDLTINLNAAIQSTNTSKKFPPHDAEGYIPWSAQQIKDQKATISRYEQTIDGQTTAQEAATRQQEQEKARNDAMLSFLTEKYTSTESSLKKQFEMEKSRLEKQVAGLEKEVLTLKDEISIGMVEMHNTQTKHEAQPAILTTMNIRRLKKENRILKDDKNSKQWAAEIRDAKCDTLRAESAQKQTFEMNRNLDGQLVQLNSQVLHLKSQNDFLERDFEAERGEVVRKDKEIVRQSKEITRLAGDLGMAERKIRLLEQHHEGVGVVAEQNKISDIIVLVNEGGENDAVTDAVESALCLETGNNEVVEREESAFPKWKVLFLFLPLLRQWCLGQETRRPLVQRVISHEEMYAICSTKPWYNQGRVHHRL